ncbi:39S ribosomal protein L22, mitochondrial [Apodemus speciosus]|uniref:Large ribosomal subunit protein uL22m n=1 Tax=Apodemus speciosus TaxID=105296 RepID=A0ABQ0FAC0_APOSI
MAAALLRELGALWVPNLRIWATQTLRVYPSRASTQVLLLTFLEDGRRRIRSFIPLNCLVNLGDQQEIYHCRRQIKYSKDKMWYLAKMIRGMSIDQALAQLEFNDKKGAQIIKEPESTSGRGQCLKRIRYHGRGRFGIMEKVYCHYFVKLVEGPPPRPEAPKTAVDHAKEYIEQLRSRTIIHTL